MRVWEDVAEIVRLYPSPHNSQPIKLPDHLPEKRLHELLLALDAVEVAAGQAVALTEVPAGLVAVEPVDAGPGRCRARWWSRRR